MSIETAPFSLSLARPLETARGTIDAREGYLVAIETGDELGIGEATPLPGWTESLEACEQALTQAIDAYRDEATDTDRRAGKRAALDTLDASETPAARHGFTAALADLEAREAGQPLYRYLGSDRAVERVPVNATIGDGSPGEGESAAASAVAEGFRCLKVKVGARSIEADVARLRAIDGAVGETEEVEERGNVEIRADANGAWSREEARRALAAFEAELGGRLAYVEQPLSASDLAGHAALHERKAGGNDGGSSIGIALDESIAEYAPETVLEREAADVLICKPMVLGGLDRAREVALRARAAGIEPVVTTTIDGAIARTGATHLAASLAPTAACGLATASLLDSDLVGSDPAPITDGYARVPQSPGTIETELTREALDGPTD
jgi:o-succinylbenzoate synthase